MPEGKKIDIPRSFAKIMEKHSEFIYRESVLVEVEGKQRPMRIKYLLEKTPDKIWIIHVIKSIGEVRKKKDEIKYQLAQINKTDVKIAGIILLIPFDLYGLIKGFDLETPVYISIYEKGGV